MIIVSQFFGIVLALAGLAAILFMIIKRYEVDWIFAYCFLIAIVLLGVSLASGLRPMLGYWLMGR